MKKQIKLRDEIENWISNVPSSATKNVSLEMVRLSTNFYSLTNQAFKLKTAWGDFHEVPACLVLLCDKLDARAHQAVSVEVER